MVRFRYITISIKEKSKPVDRQTPHCEGQGVNRRLFHRTIPTGAGSFIPARREGKSDKTLIILEAGAAQGITVGSRMAVHAYNFLESSGTSNPRLGRLIVNSVDAFSSVLKVPSDTETEKFSIPPLFYCLVEYQVSQIALYCTNRLWLDTVFPPWEREQLGVIIVNDAESSDLQLTVEGGKVYFDRRDDLVTPHIGARISHTVDDGDLSAIRNVVKSSQHFYHHLKRSGTDDYRDVRMELKILEQKINEDFDRVFNPIGKNLIADEPATIVVDESAYLGMTIFNETDLPLYPYLFYFDPTDLTISTFTFHQVNYSTNSL